MKLNESSGSLDGRTVLKIMVPTGLMTVTEG